MATKRAVAKGITKSLTGLTGFDEMTDGGIPCSKVTVLMGDAGSGKTVFALQTLANAVRDRGEPAIFVAFEESAATILTNAASFGWGLHRLTERKLFFVDARLPVDTVQSGGFELTGLLAAIRARVLSMAARWIVFDAIDVLLDLLPDAATRRREIARLREWVELLGLTCLVTVKASQLSSMEPAQAGMLYITDCAIQLLRREVDSVVTRSLTIRKYRGSRYVQNRVPYLIGEHGIAVYPMLPYTSGYKALTERVSTGIERLDTLLGNGLTRGSATLLTGAPGTAKTTISGRFAEAACERGERVLYVCFDESGAEMVRNLRSVGIELGPHERSGMLRVEGMVSRAQGPDGLFDDIVTAIGEHRPRAIVLDPLSALLKQGDKQNAADIAFRIVQQCKLRGITLCLTSLISQSDAAAESTDLHISTLADTWIHLSYLVRSGERNRAITIVKSRGTGHSNQVRELVLSSKGLTLENVYSEEGEVLMGTMRAQREEQVAEKRHLAAEELSRDRAHKEGIIEQLAARIGEQRLELKSRKRELAMDASSGHKTSLRVLRNRDSTSILRGADVPGKRGSQE